MKLLAIIDDGPMVIGYSLTLLCICRDLAVRGHEIQVISKEGGAIHKLIGSTTAAEIKLAVPPVTLLGSCVFVLKAVAMGLRKCLKRRYDALLTPVGFEAIPSLLIGRLCRTKVIGFHFDWYSLGELLLLHRGIPFMSKIAIILGYFSVLISLKHVDGLLCANTYHASLLKNTHLVRCPLEVVGLPVYREISNG